MSITHFKLHINVNLLKLIVHENFPKKY